MSRFAAIVCVFLALTVLTSPPQAGAVQYNDRVTSNPLVPGYFADPCCRKFGDTVLSIRHAGWLERRRRAFLYMDQQGLRALELQPIQLAHDHPEVGAVGCLQEPNYYMYTQVPCQVYVATASSPLGPWTNPISGGGCMVPDQTPSGTIVLDGECFIDTSGQAYLLYGTWWTPTIMTLNSDLISWTQTPIQYFSHTGYTPPNGTVQGCMEGPYMYKRNNIYYYMYSDNGCGDSTYDVEYSTGSAALGPFTYGANNPILSTSADDTVDGPGHHTVLDDGGKVFIIYHRHDNPHNADGSHRQVCADEMRFNGDNSIQKVIPTHSGVRYLAPSTKKDTNWVVTEH